MQIRNQSQTVATEVSNLFIDEYMAQANGEFVKVYLYLLRLSRIPGEDLSEAALADRLNCTETDVGRALRYWEKQGLVRREGEELLLLLPEERSGENGRTQAAACVTSDEETASSAAGREEADDRAPKKNAKKHSVSQASLDKLQEDEEFQQILYVAEKYLARPLTPRDIQLFAYLYEDLHFPEDLVEYLVEYCVEGGHRSCRYMESVALSWHAEGMRTVEQAKEAHRAYSKANKQVMKAFGITGTGRVLNGEQQDYVERWTKEYQMPLSVIIEACNYTMRVTNKPEFKFAEKTLAGWREAGVRTVEEARACQEQRRQSRKRSQKESRDGASSGNRFQNYEQRKINYDELLNQGGINVYSGREA